ncbi:MAG: undecaprenyldiphospho-muramoylpentapeptide beta-N-acetylglucosaminyltransferase [Firmicutes bacterium HGW-Firmicutes-15]|nr:MAG: undecaprenyldiphospho-muramoylpentapeptide beta-N-acetylglucosaminyltransferase [Firmicutes bacterium HGW-Firmicutes-15]
MKIILTGGGTGGHIYPALAIASEIKRRDPAVELLYVGTEKGLESKIVPPSGIPFKTIDISGIDRSSMLKAGKALIKFPFSFFQARDIIKDFRPDIIVGTGGYVSYPIVLAGTFMDVKTLIHEQNAIPGLANRNLARRVDCVLLTFEEARKYLDAKCIKLTGLPVRQEILTIDRKKANFGDKGNKFILLAFGGSLGAASINQAMLQLVERYKNEDMGIIWIAGQAGYEDMKEALEKIVDTKSLVCTVNMLPYMYNIEEALAVADLAICRAGASTVCELEVLGLPAILVPYPYAAENHQEKNARALVDKNAALMIIDEFLDGDTLYKKIEELRKKKQILQEMGQNMIKEARTNALRDIVDEILAV